jgi:hypothetical protein
MITEKKLKIKHKLTSNDFPFEKWNPKLKNPLKYFTKERTDAGRLLGGMLIKQSIKGPYFSLSYATIAEMCGSEGGGISVSSVEREMAKYINDGLVARITRPNKRCVFKISNYFNQEWVKRRIRDIFMAAIILPVALLFSMNTKSMLSEYEVRLKEVKKYLFRNNNITYKKAVVVFQKKKNLRSLEESMKIKDDILSEIGKIKRITLTTHGIIELMKYDPRAISAFNSELKAASDNIRNPEKWMFAALNRITKANEWPMNMELYRQATKMSAYDPNEPSLVENSLKTTTTRKGTQTWRTSNFVRPASGTYALFEPPEVTINPQKEKEKFLSGGSKGLSPAGQKFLESCGIKS